MAKQIGIGKGPPLPRRVVTSLALVVGIACAVLCSVVLCSTVLVGGGRGGVRGRILDVMMPVVTLR